MVRSVPLTALVSAVLVLGSLCGGCEASTAPPLEGADVEADADTGPDPEALTAVLADNTYDLELVDGVVYAEGLSHSGWGADDGESMPLLLDVYRPVDAPVGRRPAVVLIHGGGFTGGSRKDQALAFFGEVLASRGFVCFSIDYRVVDDKGTLPILWQGTSGPFVKGSKIRAIYPAARDAKAAVRWVRATADEWEVHPDHVAVVGGSAGGLLSVILAVTDEADYRDELTAEVDPTLASTSLGESAAVAAAIELWGSGSGVDLLTFLDGVSRYDATDAPLMVIHGTADLEVPFGHAEALVAAYEAVGAPVVFRPFDGGHAAWGTLIDGEHVVEVSFAYLVDAMGLEVASAE